MNREDLISEINVAIDYMRNDEEHCGCYYWYLDKNINGNDWAIVLGWNDEDDLRMKLAYQPSNSIMQCDYDIDWLLPYDKETDEVYCDDLPASSNATDIDWLLNCYKSLKEEM